MNQIQLMNIFKSDPYTRGVVKNVCARDLLPTKIARRDLPEAYVVNWDPAHLPGSHWVALFLHPVTGGEFFDSYGLPPPPECQNLLDQCSQQKCNTVMFQEDTLVCGQYCVFYLIHRCRKVSFEHITRALSRPDNDPMVHAFVNYYHPELPFR